MSTVKHKVSRFVLGERPWVSVGMIAFMVGGFILWDILSKLV